MRFSLLAALAALAPSVWAKDSRTYAVLHFHGSEPLTRGRSDPIVTPGQVSTHVHVVQGGNGFSNSATGESMRNSTCSTTDIKEDKSAYWMPALYFRDPTNGSYEAVPLYYMNVYYFFEATNDDIEAFPVGLQMISGDATKSTAPASGNTVLDPSLGTVQPAQFTCPRSSYDPPSYPVDSNGSVAGIQDTGNKGAGVGFPFAECDGYASPLRADLHFPSCYDPSAGLTAYKNNTQFPTDAGSGKQDCPEGWVHLPHIFYEVYWNTPLFADRWTPDEDYQPFVLANGDRAGYSLHGDFLAGWDTDVLQHIIDTCNAGDAGMDKCPGVDIVLEGDCTIPNPSPEQIDGVLEKLPGNNPLFGWGLTAGSTSATASTSSSTSSVKTTTSSSLTSSSSVKSASTSSSSTSSSSVKPTTSSSSVKSATTSSTSSSTKSSTVKGAVFFEVDTTSSDSLQSSTATVEASESCGIQSTYTVVVYATGASPSAATIFKTAATIPPYANTTQPVVEAVETQSTTTFAPPYANTTVAANTVQVSATPEASEIDSTTTITMRTTSTVYMTTTDTVYRTMSTRTVTISSVSASTTPALDRKRDHVFRHKHRRS